MIDDTRPPASRSQDAPSRRSHRDRSRRVRPRRGFLGRGARVAVVGLTALGVALAAWASGAVEAGGSATQSCPNGPRPLTVAAAPELATVLASATNKDSRNILGVDGDCVDVQVRAAAPADVALALQEPGAAERPDIWVPDSSLWLEDAAASGTAESTVSLARSPLVLAVSQAVATRLGWPAEPLDVVSRMTSGQGPRLGLPDPDRSAAARGGLLALQQAVSGRPDGQQRLAATLRAADLSVPDDPMSLVQAVDAGLPLAVPVPEQAVWAHGRQDGATPAVASYPTDGPALDYPLVVLTAGAATRADARLLERAVTGPTWAALVQAAGFRAGDGSAGPALAPADSPAGDHRGLDPARGRGALPPDPAAAAEAVRVFDVITSGTRMLAVIDVSGSMAARVPQMPGRTLMDLAVGAAGNGLGLYPDDASVGLWTFSTDLTATGDHRELVPIGPLGQHADGVRGRERLARALADVTYVPDGDTGLYDTALDAVRAVRQGWDPDSVNSVVLLTDGMNDDADSITLEQLLTQLRGEALDRPVPVIGIAFGPDGDIEALREISRVTGGTTYEVRDVSRIHEVLADALARRPCRPNC